VEGHRDLRGLARRTPVQVATAHAEVPIWNVGDVNLRDVMCVRSVRASAVLAGWSCVQTRPRIITLPARVRPQDADDEVPDVEIVNVLDGMTAWNAAGYPTTSA
jgi:hypothetical protein